MAIFQATVTLRRKYTVYQRQEVTATFTDAQVRKHCGLGLDDDITDEHLDEYVMEAVDEAIRYDRWSDDGDDVEDLDPSDDLEIERLEQDEIPLDTPSLDTSFHDHEMDVGE